MLATGTWMQGSQRAEEECWEKPPPDHSSIATATSPATRRDERLINERRGRTTAAVGRSGDVVNPYRSNLNNNNNYYYYIINICVFDASPRVLLSAPHQRNEHRPSAHSSCHPPRRRSPTPPIVTSYSAPRQHASSAVSLLRRSRTSRTVPPGRDDRLPLRTASSQPAASSISATGEEARPPRPRGTTKRRKRRRRAMFKN